MLFCEFCEISMNAFFKEQQQQQPCNYFCRWYCELQTIYNTGWFTQSIIRVATVSFSIRISLLIVGVLIKRGTNREIIMPDTFFTFYGVFT